MHNPVVRVITIGLVGLVLWLIFDPRLRAKRRKRREFAAWRKREEARLNKQLEAFKQFAAHCRQFVIPHLPERYLVDGQPAVLKADAEFFHTYEVAEAHRQQFLLGVAHIFQPSFASEVPWEEISAATARVREVTRMNNGGK